MADKTYNKVHVTLTNELRARLSVKAGGRPLAPTAAYLIEYALDSLGIQAHDETGRAIGKVGTVKVPE